MAEKKKRGTNFSADEREKLVELLLSHKDTILNERTDGTTNYAKSEAWNVVANNFNATNPTHRSKESLIKLWDKMKMEAKFHGSALRKSTGGTGGGPSTVKMDPLLLQVRGIMGRACTGIINVQDSDVAEEAHVEQPQIEVCYEVLPVAEGFSVPLECSLASSALYELSDEPLQHSEPSESPTGSSKSSEGLCASAAAYMPEQTPPLWSKRRRPLQVHNERSDAIQVVSARAEKLNKKKMTIESLKESMIKEEMIYQKKLFEINLKSAAKLLEARELDVLIKKEKLARIKAGRSSNSD